MFLYSSQKINTVFEVVSSPKRPTFSQIRKEGLGKSGDLSTSSTVLDIIINRYKFYYILYAYF